MHIPVLLAAGVILVSLGTRYQSYCANIARTYIINPSKTQESQYTALLAAQEAAIAALKDGQPAKASMEAAVKVSSSSSTPSRDQSFRYLQSVSKDFLSQ